MLNNEPHYKLKYKNRIIRIIYFILACNSICIEMKSLNKKNKFIFDSEIFLTVKGNGTQKILNDKEIELYIKQGELYSYSFPASPSEIFVNGKKINQIGFYVSNLSSEENNITITFNRTLTSCNVMFAGLSNITYINFNKFDSSKVHYMTGMFYGCSNLVLIDLCNFNTSSVDKMNNMFYGCTKLISLDLSSFDTSSVTNMFGMFSECRDLISLDLSSFNTSSVNYMNQMFNGCSKII